MENLEQKHRFIYIWIVYLIIRIFQWNLIVDLFTLVKLSKSIIKCIVCIVLAQSIFHLVNLKHDPTLVFQPLKWKFHVKNLNYCRNAQNIFHCFCLTKIENSLGKQNFSRISFDNELPNSKEYYFRWENLMYVQSLEWYGCKWNSSADYSTVQQSTDAEWKISSWCVYVSVSSSRRVPDVKHLAFTIAHNGVCGVWNNATRSQCDWLQNG